MSELKLCPHCGKNVEPTIEELIAEVKALREEAARAKAAMPTYVTVPYQQPEPFTWIIPQWTPITPQINCASGMDGFKNRISFVGASN